MRKAARAFAPARFAFLIQMALSSVSSHLLIQIESVTEFN